MNNGMSVNIFLDMLILIINLRDDETLSLVDQLLEAYTEESKSKKHISSILVKRFINLLTDLKRLPRGEEGNTERMSKIAEFLVQNKDVEEEDTIFFESLKTIFETARNASQSKEVLDDKKIKIKNTLTHAKFKKQTMRMYAKLNEFLSVSDLDVQSTYLADVTNMARNIVETLQYDMTTLKNGAEERVIMSDRSSMKVALDKAMAVENNSQILKTGLQGLNKMLGAKGGFSRGEWCLIYGLSHHFKTGLLLTIARGLAKYNDPKQFVTNGKKPLILLISLENYARNNLVWFFKTAYACTFGERPKSDMSIDAMMDFISEYYTSLGWDFIIEKYKGMKFSFDEYVNTIESYESRGYEVVVCLLDYMNKMKKKSSIFNGAEDTHHGLSNLAEAMFDYNKSKEILFISPHQFNRKMFEVADRHKTNVVKHMTADGVGGSIVVNQTADLEMSVYIEYDLDKNAWLTVQRGKHRYVDDTKEVDKYFAYPFIESLGILDDIGKKRGFVRDIYSAEYDKKVGDETKLEIQVSTQDSVKANPTLEMDFC